jgi:hypothetical protein
MFLNCFDILIFKINFKKYYFNILLNKNTLKKIIIINTSYRGANCSHVPATTTDFEVQ